MKNRKFLIGIDIGGTWLKGVAVDCDEPDLMSRLPDLIDSECICRVKSTLGKGSTYELFAGALKSLIGKLTDKRTKIMGIGISTAGIVNYAGTKVEITAEHLSVLKDERWIALLREYYSAPVVLVNDADAVAIGAAVSGYLQGNKKIGIMPVGTGLGFSLWKNGRKWMPDEKYPLLGSILTPLGSFDELVSASNLAEKSGVSNLSACFVGSSYEYERDIYLKNLISVATSAAIIYNLNTLLIGGGLADAVYSANFPLDRIIEQGVNERLNFLGRKLEIGLLKEGNRLPLIGACMLSFLEGAVSSFNVRKPYKNISTESPYDETLQLQEMPSLDLISLLDRAEQEVSKELDKSFNIIASVADSIVDALKQGGRLIYVGCGTSGRLAAIDTVEIACTFGFPRDRILTLISGGISDAMIDIETNFEEDASAIPELLLINLSKSDVVVGISVSGSAYYVRSALVMAKMRGAYSVMIQEASESIPPFCDALIPLRSGSEVIAGSTRMKAGTATKKVLNYISTSVMIRLGCVYGCYMVELECLNSKLEERAIYILNRLFGIDRDMGKKILEQSDYKLSVAIREYLKTK